MGLDVVKDMIPFQNLTLLGLWFLGPYGILPLVIVYGVWNGESWAYRPAILLSLVEVVWVIIQIPMVGFSYLQVVIGGIALLTLYFLYRSDTKVYLGID